MTASVRRASPDDVEALAPLFDDYRVFYGQSRSREAARDFLSARLGGGESVVFLAHAGDGHALGFAQLYPMFSSVALARVWVLNDLYVAADARRAGAGRALLEATAAFARADGALRLELETAPENAAAQALYRSAGWQAYDGTRRYHLPLGPA